MIHSCHVGVLPCLSMCLVVQVVFTTALAQAQPAALDDEAKRLQVANPPSPNQTVAARFLSDADVKAMLIGKWRMNDTEGTIDITFDLSGGFLTFRHAQVISTFHTVFVPTPVSSGIWSVQNGRLYLTISSSWRADLVNTTASYAVRSISAADAIVVDQLGRVAKVVKLP